MNKVERLNNDSSRLLSSSEIISSISTAVKELIENSLDAGSSSVEVKLENSGLDKIEVRDNGCGIKKADIPFVSQSHYTSKILSHHDLESLETYGFRGEALGALCSVADVMITTKTEDEDISTTYIFDSSGKVTASKPSASSQGTIITAVDLFKNIPVRKKFYKTEKQKKEEMKRIEDTLCAFACIHTKVRFALYHNRNLIWQKAAVDSLKAALILVLGNSVVNYLDHVYMHNEDTQVKIEGFFPKSGSAVQLTSRVNNDRCIVVVNKRPVRIKKIDKLIQEYYHQSVAGNFSRYRYPTCFVSIEVPQNKIDVNVEPNKTTVLFHSKEEICNYLSSLLEKCYGSIRSSKACENVEFEHNKKLEHPNSSNDIMIADSDSEHCSEESLQNQIKFQEKSYYPDALSSNLEGNKESDFFPFKDTETFVTTDKLVKSSDDKECDPFTHHVESRKTNEAHYRVNVNKLKLKSKQIIVKDIILHPVITQDSLLNNHISSKEQNAEKQNDFGNKSIFPPEKPASLENVFVNTKNMLHDHSSKVIALNEKQSVDKINYSNSDSDFDNLPKSFVKNANSKQKPSETDVVPQTSGFSNVNSKESKTVPHKDSAKENWQCGKLYDSSGNKLQPVTVLGPCGVKRSMQSIKKLPGEFKKKCLKENNSKTTLFDMVAFHPVRRPNSAFSYFCQDTRFEVAGQHPEYNNQEMAQVLTEQWNKLPEEKRMIYEEMAEKDSFRFSKDKKKAEKRYSHYLSTEQNSHKTLNVACKTPGKKRMMEKRKEHVIPFNIKDIKDSIAKHSKDGYKNDTEVCGYNLITPLNSGSWICSQNNKLLVFNSFRVHETVLYYRLLATYHFKADLLQEPMILTEHTVGGLMIWQTLFSLKCDAKGTEGFSYIMDERLTANGFNIRVYIGQQKKLNAEVIGITTCLPHYGLSELQEILKLLTEEGNSATLSQCRPVKVIQYLQNEAVRIMRQCPTKQHKEDIEELLRHKEKDLPASCSVCLHNKPFFHTLYDFNSLPSLD